MTRGSRILGWGIATVLVAGVALVGFAYATYGGGRDYPSLAGDPEIPEGAIEVAVTTDLPIGNVAVSADGRIFFTIHPESRPEGPKLMEWRDGKPVPFPAPEVQARLFETPLGLRIDGAGRLWVVDHGVHGSSRPSLTAFDLATGEVVHRHDFAGDEAPLGSFLQDLAVDRAGAFVYIADASFARRAPAIVVYDVKAGCARRVLEGDPSVSFQDWKIRNPIKDMVFFGGLVSLKVGIDGIAIDRKDEWVHFASMSHDTAYRVLAGELRDSSLPPDELARRVERLGPKPLSDGISVDESGATLITDVEHGAVMRLAPGGKLTTLAASPRIRWADGLSFGPEGTLYLADSAIPDLMLQSKAHIRERAPYHIFRMKPAVGAPAGQ
jgi:sugar lactone lactonase YvrE